MEKGGMTKWGAIGKMGKITKRTWWNWLEVV